jgi:hypothetical protein
MTKHYPQEFRDDVVKVARLHQISRHQWVGWFKFSRAQSGNWRAWVYYTFEWPFFGGVVIYLWRRLMHGDIPKIPKPDFEALAKLTEKD